MADSTLLKTLLQRLSTTKEPTEKAAIIADLTFEQQPPRIAQIARCCIILRWFDASIVAAFLPTASTPESALTADTVINELAQLPFVERLPWGWTYHEQTRTGLIERYATEQPDLLKQAALLAAPAYQQHSNQALARQEALFCWLVAGDLEKAQQQLDRLVDEAWGRNDWNGLLALFTTSDQAARLGFVQVLQYTAFHHYAQAVASRQLGSYEGAVAAYQQAIALDVKYARPWNGLGNVYASQKRYDEAVNAYQQAIARDAQFAYPWNGLGNVYRNQKQYDDAVDAFQQAITLDAQ